MTPCNTTPFLVCLFSLVFAQFVNAQGSKQEEDLYLNLHNAARAEVKVGPMTWDDNVAAYAQDYANRRAGDCNLVHSQGGPYGENIAVGSGDFGDGNFSGKGAFDLWVGEKPYYEYRLNQCTEGQQCLHYTQIVWRDSVRLGCARVQCANGMRFVTCNYDPPGNYIGQRPY